MSRRLPILIRHRSDGGSTNHRSPRRPLVFGTPLRTRFVHLHPHLLGSRFRKSCNHRRSRQPQQRSQESSSLHPRFLARYLACFSAAALRGFRYFANSFSSTATFASSIEQFAQVTSVTFPVTGVTSAVTGVTGLMCEKTSLTFGSLLNLCGSLSQCADPHTPHVGASIHSSNARNASEGRNRQRKPAPPGRSGELPRVRPRKEIPYQRATHKTHLT